MHEFKTKGPVYRRTVQTTLKASYSNHYRRGLIELLEVLEFRSGNATQRPVLDALDLIKRHAGIRLTYYPAGETVPSHKGVRGDWTTLVYKDAGKAGRRVVRNVYEICTFQALRERLRCKEIWVVGADKWRNPDEDLPHDFEAVVREVQHLVVRGTGPRAGLLADPSMLWICSRCRRMVAASLTNGSRRLRAAQAADTEWIRNQFPESRVALAPRTASHTSQSKLILEYVSNSMDSQSLLPQPGSDM